MMWRRRSQIEIRLTNLKPALKFDFSLVFRQIFKEIDLQFVTFSSSFFNHTYHIRGGGSKAAQNVWLRGLPLSVRVSPVNSMSVDA